MHLQIETIDLYQFHARDPRVPLEESVGALARLEEEGKLSNVVIPELEHALRIVDVASVQNRYSVLTREPERDGVLAACATRWITLLAYSPLNGKRRSAELACAGGGTLARIATRLGASVQQVALAWLLAKSPTVVPIPGATTVAHATDSAGAWQVALGQEDIAAIDRAFE